MGISSVDPFNDPNFKKKLLGDQSSVCCDEEFVTEAEDIDIKSLVTGSVTSVPKTAKNLILDASVLAKSQKEQKAVEMNAALNNVFSNYNKEYGTDLQIDFSNLSRTLVNVSDPDTRKTLELYVSEVFRSIRPILLLHLINKLALAIDYATQPERMFDSNSFTPADTFLIVEKLMLYIDQLNALYQSTAIKDSDQILRKLAESKNNADMESEESKKAVNDFLSMFRKDSGVK